MIPVECVVRNYAAGSLVKRLGVEEGLKLNPYTFELFLKDDAKATRSSTNPTSWRSAGAPPSNWRA